MSDESRSAHLDPEILAAYLDGTLPPQERARVEAAIAANAETYEWVVNAMRVAQEAEDVVVPTTPAPRPAPVPVPGPSPAARSAPVVDSRRRRPWMLAAGSLALAAAVVLAVRVTRPADPRAGLVEAVGEQRYVEARLTGGFAFGPLQTATRGPADVAKQNLALLAEAGGLQKKAQADPSAANLHAWGVAQVLLGDYDGAVATLEAAADVAPGVADVQTDLSVALMARARASDRADDWPRAVAASERALQVAPDSLEALFNRAFALQQLNLASEARKYWDEYLQKDGGSPWRAEAERLRAQLDESSAIPPQDARQVYLREVLGDASDAAGRLVAADVQLAREVFEDDVLPSWATSTGDEAARWTAAARALADAIAKRTSDRLPGEVVAVLDAAGPAAVVQLRHAASRWKEARALYARNEMAQMHAAFGETARAYTAAGSPMALWARHFEVVGLYYLGRIPEAEQLCLELMQQATARGYRALEARLNWDLGTLHYQRARFEQALERYQAAARLLGEIGEVENAVAMNQATAEAYGRLGEPLWSWRFHRAALGGLPFVRDPRRRHTVLAAAGHSALNLGMPEVAYHLFDAAVDNAQTWTTPAPLVEAFLNRARAATALGRGERAREDLAAATGALEQITDAAVRTRFGGDLMLARAEAHLQEDPEAALQAIDVAVASSAALASEYRVAALHLVAARAALRANRPAAGIASLERGIAVLESSRAIVQQRSLRVSFFDSVWDLYAERIRLAVEAGDHVAAVEWVERSRARMLLDDVAGEVADVPALRARLAPGQALVYYAVQEDRLLEWLLTSDALVFATVPVTRSTARHDVAAFRAALERKDAARIDALAARLGAALVEPLRLTGRGLRQVAFVPDAILEPLAFAALRDAAGQFLPESVDISVVPSGSVLGALDAASVASPATTRASVIADPSPPAELAATMPALSGAAREAREIAALYAAPVVITGERATPSAFAEALATSQLVHFGGHALADPAQPWQARLVMSPEATSPTGMLALDSLKPRSAGARVVVLAACETGLGRGSRGEGLLSLSRPLLAAGVRNVLVTKWRVDDAAMAELSKRFHGELRMAGRTAVQALRAAQRTLMRSPDPMLNSPSTWAALEAQGVLQ
jgi:CHAT domain-containing protein